MRGESSGSAPSSGIIRDVALILLLSLIFEFEAEDALSGVVQASEHIEHAARQRAASLGGPATALAGCGGRTQVHGGASPVEFGFRPDNVPYAKLVLIRHAACMASA
jgi:hypothetical protein